MFSAAFLAILCLLASGFLDLVFKLYTKNLQSRGMLIFGIGCIWGLLQIATNVVTEKNFQIDNTTLVYGLTAAFFVTVSNILLVECLAKLPISMASTIYRLNTIPLVVLAYFILNEDIQWMKAFGIIAGLITVILLYQPGKDDSISKHQFKIFIILIIIASFLRALYGLFTKAGINSGSQIETMMLLAALGWIIGGFLYASIREKNISITPDLIKFTPIAGILVFSIIWLLTTALTLGDASVIVPIANMGFVAAFILSIFFRLESLNKRTLFAIFCAIASVILLSRAI